MSKPNSPKPTKTPKRPHGVKETLIVAERATPKAKPSQPKPRPGEQVVYRVPAEVKALVQRMAHEAHTSMNAAATERLATGKWPQPKKAEKP